MSKKLYLGYDALDPYLIGQAIVEADFDSGVLTLSNGVKLQIQKYNSECCSYIELIGLSKTENIITAVKVGNTPDDEGPYTAWINVLTEAGSINIAQAEGDASNGYYLHGFSLGITVYTPDEEVE